MRVGTDVAGREGRAGLGRVQPPSVGEVDGPVLEIFDVDLPDAAERAVCHHLPGLAHHGVTRERVGDAEYEARPAPQGHEVERLGELCGQRLVGDDVDAVFHEGAGDRVMGGVGSRDRHRVDPVGPGRLAGRHGMVVGVAAVGGQEPLRAGLPRHLGSGRQGTGHDLLRVRQPRPIGVDRPDEGAPATAHDAEAQPAAGPREVEIAFRLSLVPARHRDVSAPIMMWLSARSAPDFTKSSKAWVDTSMM